MFLFILEPHGQCSGFLLALHTGILVKIRGQYGRPGGTWVGPVQGIHPPGYTISGLQKGNAWNHPKRWSYLKDRQEGVPRVPGGLFRGQIFGELRSRGLKCFSTFGVSEATSP